MCREISILFFVSAQKAIDFEEEKEGNAQRAGMTEAVKYGVLESSSSSIDSG